MKPFFLAYAIDGRYINTVGDGVASLNRGPGLAPVPLFFFYTFNRPNGRRIKNDIRPLKGHRAGGLWKPLVVTDEDGDLAQVSGDDEIPRISRGKIIFFIEVGILGDVDLAVFTEELTFVIDDDGRVEELAPIPFENGSRYEDDIELPGQTRKGFGGGARDGFC